MLASCTEGGGGSEEGEGGDGGEGEHLGLFRGKEEGRRDLLYW